MKNIKHHLFDAVLLGLNAAFAINYIRYLFGPMDGSWTKHLGIIHFPAVVILLFVIIDDHSETAEEFLERKRKENKDKK